MIGSTTHDFRRYFYIMKEVWKDIPNYEGHYQVSDQGRVKSLKFGKERIMKQPVDGHGYVVINLSLNCIRKVFKGHKLVAMAFLGHEPNGHSIVVDHINNIKTDNRLCNLQLISQRDNSSKDQWRGNHSSKYVGVSLDKNGDKWVANITVDKKKIYLGYFDKELDAHNVYQRALVDFKKGREITVTAPSFSSKYKGVSWHKGKKTWRSVIYMDKKTKHLGYFTSEIDAHNAYQKALKNIKKNGR